MDIRTMTTEEALTLAKQVARDAVQLIAIEYNWGAPVGGRFDTDFMQFWAAAQTGAGTGSLFLRGARVNGDWSIDVPFERTASFTNSNGIEYEFFSLALESQYDFPTQFVLRFEPEMGEAQYDNDHGQNYFIEPYRGRGMSAIRKGTAIFDMGRILPCRLFSADLTDPMKVSLQHDA